MKNRYRRVKEKIHPSLPRNVMDVLNILPAAVLALTAALGAEDQEVLAYLVTQSIQGPCSSEAAEKRRGCLRQSRHQLLLDCGCFDCYTSYWCRWDSSPDCKLIHHAIEAFEEHLSSLEQHQSGGKGNRRRDRQVWKQADRGKKQMTGKGSNKRRPKKDDENGPSVNGAGARYEQESSGDVICLFREEVVDVEVPRDFFKEPDDRARMEMVAMIAQQQGDERRRAWRDVMSLFGSRLWGLWRPAA